MEPIATWARAVRQLQAQGQRVGCTNGVFELITPGHVRYLRDCRRHCDFLLVLVNDDASARALAKGDGRPFTNEGDRLEVVRSLRPVGGALLFHEETPARAASLLRPDRWFKDEEYRHRAMPEREAVEAYGGQVVYLSRRPWATTDLVSRIQARGRPHAP